jgi:hypothetical protein
MLEVEKAPPLGPKFTQFTLKPGCTSDPEVAQILREADQHPSILHLIKGYMDTLENDTRPGAPTLGKLEKLVACGRVSDRIEGYQHGLTAVLKAGDHPFGGFLNQLWGTALADVSPWDGKSFSPMTADEVTLLTAGAQRGDPPAFIGINGFTVYDQSLLNRTSMAVLTFWLDLQDAPQAEQETYGYHKKGGHFIARRAKSIDPKNLGNDVLRLNYRWKNLKNPVPLRYLMDEIVQIAEGLYLGPLLFATQRLLEDFDPDLDPNEYAYQNFGYFLLMDDQWDEIKNRLRP